MATAKKAAARRPAKKAAATPETPEAPQQEFTPADDQRTELERDADEAAATNTEPNPGSAVPAAQNPGELATTEGKAKVDETTPAPEEPQEKRKAPKQVVVLTAFHAATEGGAELSFRVGDILPADHELVKGREAYFSDYSG